MDASADAEGDWYRFLAAHPELMGDEMRWDSGPEFDPDLVEFPFLCTEAQASRFLDCLGHWIDHQCIPALKTLMFDMVEPMVDQMADWLYPDTEDVE